MRIGVIEYGTPAYCNSTSRKRIGGSRCATVSRSISLCVDGTEGTRNATSARARVDDESAMLGDLVIERPARLVADLRLPINPAATGRAGGVVNGVDQTPTDAATTEGGCGEQI